MPAIIDSAPDCVANVAGATPADDSADFIIQAAYEKCAGFIVAREYWSKLRKMIAERDACIAETCDVPEGTSGIRSEPVKNAV